MKIHCSGVVKIEDLFPYVEYKEQFTKPLKRKDYNDALEEIEAALKDGGQEVPTKKTEVETDENDEGKRGVKRKLSSDSVENEPKLKKSSPLKNASQNKKDDKGISPGTADCLIDRQSFSTCLFDFSSIEKGLDSHRAKR